MKPRAIILDLVDDGRARIRTGHCLAAAERQPGREVQSLIMGEIAVGALLADAWPYDGAVDALGRC